MCQILPIHLQKPLLQKNKTKQKPTHHTHQTKHNKKQKRTTDICPSLPRWEDPNKILKYCLYTTHVQDYSYTVNLQYINASVWLTPQIENLLVNKMAPHRIQAIMNSLLLVSLEVCVDFFMAQHLTAQTDLPLAY